MRTRVFVLLLGAAGLGLAQTPAISSGGIVNAASFSATTPVTPGSLFTIFGTNLASSAAAADKPARPPPITITSGIHTRIDAPPSRRD